MKAYIKAVAIVLGLSLGLTVANAQVEIPEGAVLDWATLSINGWGPSGPTVNVHRITADWEETNVTWNSFAGSYAPEVEASFVPLVQGWHTVDVTGLVGMWMDGTYPNFGMLLEQGDTRYTSYKSSENLTIEERPFLTIAYTTASGSFTSVVHRAGVEPGGVADAYIWALHPDQNYGLSTTLYTGIKYEYEKQTLIRFDFTPVPPEDCEGTGTPGYWKNHPEAWPVDEITIGGIVYSKEEAIGWMMTSNSKDKTITMFRALVAAKLNVLMGCKFCCVETTMVAADMWMESFPVGSGIAAGGKDSPWREGDMLYQKLDDYNNGLLCAPHRD